MSEAVFQIPVRRWLNVFLVPCETGAILVDAGNPGQADLILERLAHLGVSPQEVRLILITHGHADHYGSAATLRQRTGAPLAVHKLDAPVLRCELDGLQDIRPTSKLLDLLMRIPGLRFSPRLPAIEPDIVFDDEWRLDDYGVAGRVIPTPGHTPGSVSVLLDSGEAIVGDMVMGKLMGLLPQPGPPIIAWDLDRNSHSVRQLAALSPRIIYASHGGPFKDLSGLI